MEDVVDAGPSFAERSRETAGKGHRQDGLPPIPPAWAALSWLLVIPIVCALATVLYWSDIFVPNGPRVDGKLFLGDGGAQCIPDPLKHARYLIAITLVPGMFWVGAVLFRGRSLPGNFDRRGAVVFGVVAAQIALEAFLLRMWWVQNVEQFYPYIRAADVLRGGALVAGGAVSAYGWRKLRAGQTWLAGRPIQRTLDRALPPIIAAVACLFYARTAFVTERQFPFLNDGARVHFSFTSGEFAAVLNGRTPLVDFYPQYSNLLPILLSPVLRAVGFNVTTFSATMAILCVVESLLAYTTLNELTRRPWVNLAMFLPFLAFSRALFGGYYAVSPLRFFGPFLVMCLCARFWRTPTWTRALLAFFIAGMSAINNLDFGVPAFVAAGAAILATGAGGIVPTMRRLAFTLSAAILGAGGAIGFFITLCELRTGQMPSLAAILMFQKLFAVNGFFAIPLRNWGMHWLLYAAWMAALLQAVVRLAAFRPTPAHSSADLPEPLRMFAGLLIFSSVFAFGSFEYFIHRAHPTVMATGFPMWSFSVLLLLWPIIERACIALEAPIDSNPEKPTDLKVAARDADQPLVSSAIRSAAASPKILYLPSFLMLVIASLGFTGFLGDIPGGKFGPPGPDWSYANVRSAWVAGISRETGPREKVAIVGRFSHELALHANVDNVFPFAEGPSMALVAQMDLALDRIAAAHVSKIFGAPAPEMIERLRKMGFHQVWSMSDSFAYWRRQ